MANSTSATSAGAGPLGIGLIGDHDPAVLAHRAIPEAIRLAAERLDTRAEATWLATEDLPAGREAALELLEPFDALWCVPASPYRHTEGALAAIEVARARDIPFFGSCGGFQHALVEIARNVLGIEGAAHAELDPSAEAPVITPLACALVETRGAICLAGGSKLAAAYRPALEVEEGYHCSYGLDPAFASRLGAAGVAVTARDRAGDVRGCELAGPRFFVATLFQPERRALAGEAPPPVVALLEAALAARRDGVRLVHAMTESDRDAIQHLMVEYSNSLGYDLSYQDFDAELAALPGAYTPPRGALFLVTVRGQPAACVGMRPLEDGFAEMKRLYVRRGFRGLGLGDRLARAAIAAARTAGHRAIRLDTLPGMAVAQALYERLGFRDIPPYCESPEPGTRHLELRLDRV